jgi:hypothetical protein
MNTLDIRGGKEQKIEKIVFAEKDWDFISAISQESTYIAFYTNDNDDDTVILKKTDVPHLVAALQKAKELGWWTDVKPETKKPATKKAVVAKKPTAKK